MFEMEAACCRFYHTLFFLMATHIKLGQACTLFGKMLPGKDFGYTWCVVKNLNSKNIIVDIYEETAKFPDDHYKDSSGKYQGGNPFVGYTNKDDGFRFRFLDD